MEIFERPSCCCSPAHPQQLPRLHSPTPTTSRTPTDNELQNINCSALAQLLADAFTCPVCASWAHPIHIFLDCGHLLCGPCCSAWLRRARSCPICRTPAHDDPIPCPPLDNFLISAISTFSAGPSSSCSSPTNKPPPGSPSHSALAASRSPEPHSPASAGLQASHGRAHRGARTVPSPSKLLQRQQAPRPHAAGKGPRVSPEPDVGSKDQDQHQDQDRRPGKPASIAQHQGAGAALKVRPHTTAAAAAPCCSSRKLVEGMHVGPSGVPAVPAAGAVAPHMACAADGSAVGGSTRPAGGPPHAAPPGGTLGRSCGSCGLGGSGGQCCGRGGGAGQQQRHGRPSRLSRGGYAADHPVLRHLLQPAPAPAMLDSAS